MVLSLPTCSSEGYFLPMSHLSLPKRDRTNKGSKGGRPVSHDAGLHLHAAMTWLKDLTRTTP